MEIKVVSEKKNPYMDRVEYVLELDHSGEATPKRELIIEYIKERLSLDPSKCILLKIDTLTGASKSTALIYYYPDGIDWSQIEAVHRRKVIEIGKEESEAKGEEA
jgi:ribosomal protein S24E